MQCSYLEAPSGFGPEYKGFADLRLTTWLRRLKNGAVDEARTRDLNLGKVALYQLSYYRVKQMWCGRRDLNSYVVRHQILSLARLPFRHARLT